MPELRDVCGPTHSSCHQVGSLINPYNQQVAGKSVSWMTKALEIEPEHHEKLKFFLKHSELLMVLGLP